MIISRRLLFQNSKWKKLGTCNFWTKNSTVVYSSYYNRYVIFEKCSTTSYISFTSDFKTFKTFSSTVCANIDSKTGKVFYTDDSSGRASNGGFTSSCIIGYIDANFNKKEQTLETIQPLESGWASVDLTEICRMGNYLIFNYSTNARPTASGLGAKQNWAQKYAYSSDDGATWKIVTLGHGENVLNGDYDDIKNFGYNNGKYIAYAEFDTCYKFLVFTTPTKYTAYNVSKGTSGSNPYSGDTFYLNGTWYISDNFRGYKSTDGHTFESFSSNLTGWINKSTIYLSDIKKYLTVRERNGIRLHDETFANYKEISFPNKNKLNSLLGVIDRIVYVQTNDKYIYSAPFEDLIK